MTPVQKRLGAAFLSIVVPLLVLIPIAIADR
jgi:hypothetical protein